MYGANGTFAKMQLIEIEHLKNKGYSHKEACNKVWGTEEEQNQIRIEVNVVVIGIFGLILSICAVIGIVGNIQ